MTAAGLIVKAADGYRLAPYAPTYQTGLPRADTPRLPHPAKARCLRPD